MRLTTLSFLHLGHVVAHKHFKRNLARCAQGVRRDGHEYSYLGVNTNKGLVFSEVTRGTTTSGGNFWSSETTVFLGSQQQKAAGERVFYRHTNEQGILDAEKGEGLVFHFHIHPDFDEIPMFSLTDFGLIKGYTGDALRLGQKVSLVGGVGNLTAQSVLRCVFYKPRNLLDCHWMIEMSDELGDASYSSIQDVLRIVRGDVLFLDFPFRRGRSITISDSVIEEASRMVLVDTR